MSSFRVCPGNGVERQAVGETRMEFDYYFDDGSAGGGMEGWPEYFQFVRKVAMEDFELCETAQSNLQRGVYSQGCLNGVKESGVVRKFCSVLLCSPFWPCPAPPTAYWCATWRCSLVISCLLETQMPIAMSSSSSR